MVDTKTVTPDQALRAVDIILHLADQAGGPCELRLAHPATQEILDLAEEINSPLTRDPK